ncbi:clamp loader subunit [Synechococcus phage S-MbCM6]|jgi:DNA polymerase III delta prime subunit|uniref:Sliding-clamp-loader large subunit n=3 Tax=Namakavirus smbcm6 TaxID=2734120 RepID=V5USY9_9CAUD|nr:clamp loader subunit [Synechococcus phage S-MbCM25]AIX14534.1 clamp loader subunit [Synechococcus phage ACG-2014c]AIX22691.1 clamp loader subunit [Synechococcus phage ACG-2014c]AIX22906.1 clamp loader subunit [Synechococcus phage ACG-2014c]AIX38138.1 clamp loader subunit [Synechococcus phage ACG-2014c]
MNDFLWVEKYRPQTVEECILPADVKETFQSFIDQGEIPNLLLSGTAGVGKTTIAKALCKELGADYYVINGSDEGRFLDTVRNQAKNFASTVSLTASARHKVLIIDEADNTTPDVQLLLRASIEEFQKNCRFIFTCNFKNKIIDPLHSRTTVVEFNVRGQTKQQLAAQFFKRCEDILGREKVTFAPRVLAEVVQKYFPDFRRTLNELQRYSSTGSIDTGILATLGDANIKDLTVALKEKKFNDVKKWVTQNLDSDPSAILRKVYDNLADIMDKPSVAAAVLIIAEYQYKSAFVADQEINLLAALTQIMLECNFK